MSDKFMRTNEMRGFINSLIRDKIVLPEKVTSQNWKDIQDKVVERSRDTNYYDFTYEDIYPNEFIIKRGGRKKKRHTKRKKSKKYKKSKKHHKKKSRRKRR